ncbi:MAG TPA: YbjN domain-containing protein [Actinomycetales bacterium]|jgi:hypothetical protein|nr:YbjN domain-containing protein [Actinomycetales bacterium]
MGNPRLSVVSAVLSTAVPIHFWRTIVRAFGSGRRQEQQVLPLTHELIIAVLEAEELKYSVDSDGDIHGMWDGGSHFYFLRLGGEQEIFHVRGRWHRSLPVDLAQDAQTLCAEWNRDMIFPKTYTRVDDEGRVWLYGELSTDLEHGVTSRQLTQLIHCGVGTTLQFFTEADKRFPESVISTITP